MSDDRTSYVVYYCEQMRDGTSDGAKVVVGLENALAVADKIVNGFCGDNTEVRLFELGVEIPLKRQIIEEAQPARTKAKMVVASSPKKEKKKR